MARLEGEHQRSSAPIIVCITDRGYLSLDDAEAFIRDELLQISRDSPSEPRA